MSPGEGTIQGSLFDQPQPEPPSLPETPFRLKPREAAPDTLRALNQAQGRAGASRFLPPHRAERMAYTQQSAVQERLDSWIHHPDERVPIALLENPNDATWKRPGREFYRIREFLLERALREADEEGHVWTPLLDALVSEGYWKERAYRGDGEPHEGPTARLQQLVDWLSSRPEGGGRALEMLKFRATSLHRVVAQHTHGLGVAEVGRILHHDPTLAYFLARNEHLEGEPAEALLEWAFDQLELAGRRTRQGSDAAGPAASAILHLHTHRRPLIAEEWTRLLAVVKSPEPSRGSARDEAFRLLARGGEGVPEAILYELYHVVHDDSPSVLSILRHDAATVALWRHIAQDSSHFDVRDFLSTQAEARRDAPIRAVLGRSTSPQVMRRLLEDAKGEELRRHFGRLIQRDIKEATRALHAMGEEQVRQLTRHDLLPLLRSENDVIRRVAVMATGRVGGEHELKREQESGPGRA